MPVTATRSEQVNRTVKAVRLVDFLRAHGGELADSSTVAQLSEHRRAQVAELAGERAPSADTWAAVVALLAAGEASRAACADPFAGLPA